MLRSVATAIACAAIVPCSVAAQSATDEEEKVYPVPGIEVQAPRAVTTVGGSSAVEANVDSLRIPAAATIEEVLRELPLLHVRKNSRGEAEISARGSESRQVAVLVDGVPITLAWDARADVSVLPATALQDVTFTRGLSSMLYGPNVLGGIVEARIGQSPTQPAERSMQITMGADDVGTFGTTVSTAIPFEHASGTWLARGGVGFRDTPGDPLAKDIEEPIDTGDDLRLNTDEQTVDGFLALRYHADNGAWLAFSGSSFKEERGMAAELGVEDGDARFWRYPHVSRTLAVVSGGSGFHDSPFGGRGDVEASVGFDRGRTDIDAYTSRDYDAIDSFENGKDHTLTLRVLADQTLGSRGDLRGAFTWSDIHHDEIIPDGTFKYQQQLMSLGVENIWRLKQSGGKIDALSFSVGGAYDHAETPEAGGRVKQDPMSELGGRVGLSAVVANGRTILHAGVSRRGRFPALRELYSGALGRFLPNPDLEPEKLLTTEAGFTSRIGTSEVQVVGFHNLLEDAVVRITLDDEERHFMRVNRNELKSTGIELLAAHAIGPVDVSGSATFQSVDLTDTDANETNRPENLPEAFGELNLRFPIVQGLACAAGVEYTGDQFVIDAVTGEDAELDAEAVINASVSRTWPMHLSWGGGAFAQIEARVALDNAGDVALYDAFGLPEPGRRVRFELRLR